MLILTQRPYSMGLLSDEQLTARLAELSGQAEAHDLELTRLGVALAQGVIEVLR